MPHFTFEQWVQLCQLAIFPACWFLIKAAGKKIIKEFHDSMDARADIVAIKRTAELKGSLDAIKQSFEHEFNLHEAKDVKRYSDLVDLINALSNGKYS